MSFTPVLYRQALIHSVRLHKSLLLSFLTLLKNSLGEKDQPTYNKTNELKYVTFCVGTFLMKHVIEGTIEREGEQGRRRKQLLYDLKGRKR